MKKSTKIILAVISLFIIIVIVAFSWNINDDDNTIIVAVDENPPYTYTTVPTTAYFEEGGADLFKSATTLQFQGFDIDVLTAAAKISGLKIEFREIGFAETLQQMKRQAQPAKNFLERLRTKKNSLDLVIGGLSVTDERKQFADFTIPYASGGACIVTLQKNNIDNILALQGKTVGVEQATTFVDKIKTMAGVHVKVFPNQQTLLSELQKGMIDAIMIDSVAAGFYVKDAKMTQLKLIPLPADEQFAMMARKGNRQLIDKLNQALTTMQTSGELQLLYDKWFKTDNGRNNQ